MELTDVFMAAMESPISIPLPDKKSYDNLRTMLIRKLRKYNQVQSSFGLPADTYLKASYKDGVATFYITYQEDRIRKKTYTVHDI